jgi:hypothetical protein
MIEILVLIPTYPPIEALQNVLMSIVVSESFSEVYGECHGFPGYH